MENFPFYSAGEFVSGSETISVSNPYSGKEIAVAGKAGKQDLEQAITQAKKMEPVMKKMPSWQKYEILTQIAEGIKTQKDYFTAILCKEAAKPWKYAAGEVDRAIAVFTAAAEESKRLPREYLDIEWTKAGQGREGLVKYFPIGLVGGITPFNFPINLAVHKLAPAIAAGCPIILKPSSSTPLSTLALARIIHETSLPKGALSVLPMDREVGYGLVTDERIKMVTFTGSPDVGWKMKQDAGKKRVALELGGNAGVIVTPTANIEYAVDRCVMGAFSYSGQVCIHAQRILIHQSVIERFTALFIQKTLELRIGDPLDPATDISAMIDEKNAIRVEKWITEAKDGGARIVCGGTREGAIVTPTIILNSIPDMKVNACEVFGPVVTLFPYNDFSDAVDFINESDFGLQAGVFTNQIDEMNSAFSELEVGGLILNDVPTFRVDHMPYGGVKNSGFGREGVRYTILEMMEPRLLVKNY
jgi:glyceraldehyde-3-phosphate dehydrogenase (NADP+)